MRWWFVVGLFCLSVLFYYGINNYGVKTKHQSALNEGADAALLARPRSDGRMASEVVLPVKEDASFPDDGEPGDPASSGPIPQRNTDTFLDVEGNDIDSGFFLSNESERVNIGNIYRSGWFGVTRHRRHFS
jgi:hypothetical protein